MKPRHLAGFFIAQIFLDKLANDSWTNCPTRVICLHTTETDMTQTKHTAGKWSYSSMTMTARDWAALHSGKHPIDIVRRNGDVIAAVWCGDDRDGEEQANARLIAAAPDMLEALKTIAKIGREDYGPAAASRMDEIARAAIAKAEGR